MRGGSVGGICFLALLLSSGIKGQNLLNSYDLQQGEIEDSTQNNNNLIEETIKEHDTVDVVNLTTNFRKSSVNSGLSITNDLTKESNMTRTETRSATVWNKTAETSNQSQNLKNTSFNINGLPISREYTNSNSSSTTSVQTQAFSRTGGNSGSTETKSTEEHNADEELKVNSQYPTDKADANGQALGQYDLDLSESQASSASSELMEMKSENQVILDSENDPEINSRFGASSAYAFAGATSRVISQREYIVPHLTPGGENLIVCSRESELHNVWSPVYECLVCVCVREGWTLQAVCVSCNTCLNPIPIIEPTPVPIFPPPPPPLPPVPIPIPVPPVPVPIIPPPQPESQVSCDPLPTNTPFPNPFNRCQICVCMRNYDILGQPDIEIKCEKNPECEPTPDIIPIPPEPVPPQPEPMSLCEGFPPNVPFPHPSDSCKICKCVVDVPYYTPEERIICIGNPECDISVEPINVIPEEPEIIPEVPDEPSPIIPVPEPETIPWPPIVRPSTPPSPLPGPPPHETCKPYPPNVPFQHPWDECQICMCSEMYGANVVNIEVNCYTKKSCCIEPPIPEPVVTPLPLPMYPTSNIIFIEPRCRYQLPEQQFVSDCNVCVCQVVYSYVIAKCFPQPNCGAPYPLIGGNAEASAQAIANAQSYSLQKPYDIGVPGTPTDLPYSISGNNGYAPGSVSNALAESEAIALTQSGNLSPYTNSYLPSPDFSQSSAMAQANAQSLSNQPSYLSGGYPFTDNNLFNAQAQAEAIANTNFDNSAPYSQYPYSLPGNSFSNAQAEAEAYANTMNAQNTLPNTQYNGLSEYGNYPYSLGPSSANAQSEAMAQANAQSLSNQPSYLSGGYPFTDNNLFNAQAQAEAIANTNFDNSAPYSQYPYSLPGNSFSNAQAEAEAYANNINAQNTLPNTQYNGLSEYGNYPYSLGQSSANAQSEANAQYGLSFNGPTQNYLSGNPLLSQQLQGNNPANVYLPNSLSQYNPYSLEGSQSSSSAQAEAIANSLSGNSYISPLYGYPNNQFNEQSAMSSANAVAASELYPNLYQQPSLITPLYQPGTSLGNILSQMQGVASAQSLALTSASSGRPLIRSGPGLCKYNGDKYHHNCQACFCFQEDTGNLYTLCLGNPCA